MIPLQFCDKHNACSDGRKFALRFATMAEVWDACERPNWLLWIVRKLRLDPRASVRIACRVVRETPGLWEMLTDERSRRAVEAAEAWVRGEVGVEELRAAAYAAADAAYAYAADGAARAAAAARDAAYAAYAADGAAQFAAAAANAAADCTAAARKLHCDIIRQEIPNPFAS